MAKEGIDRGNVLGGISDLGKALLAMAVVESQSKVMFQVVQIARLESCPWSLLRHRETLKMD